MAFRPAVSIKRARFRVHSAPRPAIITMLTSSIVGSTGVSFCRSLTARLSAKVCPSEQAVAITISTSASSTCFL